MPTKDKPRTKKEKLDKQSRARMRRAQAKAERTGKDVTIEVMVQAGWAKPLDEWDLEELAAGRPKNGMGNFRNTSIPNMVQRQVHEEAIRRFTDIARGQLRATVPAALKLLDSILTDETTDSKGNPRIGFDLKLRAAQWTIEMLVGKPKQKMDVDVSAKLQAVLAHVMVNVEEGQERPAYLPVLETEQEPDEDEDLAGGDD